MEPDGIQSSRLTTMANASTSTTNFNSVQIIIRKRRRVLRYEDEEHICSNSHHQQHPQCRSMTLSFYPLVLLMSLLLLCLIPLPVESLPFDGSIISGSRSSSHRSQVDLLIDPIHQAEFGDEELESKRVVAKSVFDMVLRTPPPPTRCPPGTQSPFEGGPCIKKSTGPVALLDQSFLLEELRGLAKEGVLLSGKRKGSGGGSRRKGSATGRPGSRVTTSTTTAPSTTIPTTTETIPETTIVSPGGSSDSGEIIAQTTLLPPVVDMMSSVPGKSPESNKFPGETNVPLSNPVEVTLPTTPITTPVEELTVVRDDDLLTTTRTEVPPPQDDQSLSKQESGIQSDPKDEQAITITATAPPITTEHGNSPQNFRVEEKSGQDQVRDHQQPESLLSSKNDVNEDVERVSSVSNGNLSPSDDGSNKQVLPSTATAETTVTTTLDSTSPITFTKTEMSADFNSGDIKPSSHSQTIAHEESTGAVEVTGQDIPGQSSEIVTSDIVHNQNVNFPQPFRQTEGIGVTDKVDDDSSSLVKTRMMQVDLGQQSPLIPIQALRPTNEDGNIGNSQDKVIEENLDTTDISSSIATGSSLSTEELEGTSEDEVLFLDSQTNPSPMSSSSATSATNTEQEPSNPSLDESNNAGINNGEEEERVLVVITKVQPDVQTEDLVLPEQEERQMMIAAGDMNMTAPQPLESFGSADREEEQSEAITKSDVDPSSSVVNHPVVSEMMTADQDLRKTVGKQDDIGSGDLVIINNPKVSPAHHIQMQNGRQQVILNKDREIAHPTTKDYVEESSSKDDKRNVLDETRGGDQPVFEMKMESPELTTLIPSTPMLPNIASSTFQPKNTLLQFQLPIVTRGPVRYNNNANNFEKFDEFPGTGRVRFPNELPPEEQAGPVKVNFRGTFRPLFVQDFQVDYTPPQRRQLEQPVEQPKWEVAKPFFPTADDSPVQATTSEYATGSTEYLESELDRRHQKTRSRNRIRLPESTTNPPLPPELSLYQQQQHHPTPSNVQHPSPPSQPQQQQPFYYAHRNPSSDLTSFGYLNFRSGNDRFNKNNRRLVW